MALSITWGLLEVEIVAPLPKQDGPLEDIRIKQAKSSPQRSNLMKVLYQKTK